MSLTRAVIWLDQQNATLVRLGDEQPATHLRAQHHHTRQHGSDVRTSHEFHAHVCDAMQDVDEVLVTGSKMAHADFRHYVDKHRPHLARQIVAWQIVDHPTEPQLRACADRFFTRYDHLAPQSTA